MSEYFSDRERGATARTVEVVSIGAWGGIVALIQSLVSTGAFGSTFPETCPDGGGAVGTDEESLSRALRADIPNIEWPLSTTKTVQNGFFSEAREHVPDTLDILDLVEFCYGSVAKPLQGEFHSYFRHHHLTFGVEEGREDYRARINRIFSRNGLAYELGEDGRIVRIAPAVIREALQRGSFRTGDAPLDAMLELSRSKFLNPDPLVRKESLEKLWDCWERIKSLENSENKRASVATLLEIASADTSFRAVLDAEARQLTEIGNSFHIRHSEVGQSIIEDRQHVDYLFHRLYSMIQLLLSKRRQVR